MKEKCILNFKTLQIIIIVGVGCVIEIEKICVQEREGPLALFRQEMMLMWAFYIYKLY